MELIAEFRDSFFKDGFGYDVEVYENNPNEYIVLSEGKLKDKYESFELFFEDLIVSNPLWYTYYFVRINSDYTNIVTEKIKKSIDRILEGFSRTQICMKDNWMINGETANFSEIIKEKIESFNLIS